MGKQVNLVIQNIKKIKDFNADFQSGYLYLIRGGNEKGKTTLLNTIKDLLTASSTTRNAVTFGEESGLGILTFIGGDGKRYSIKGDFTQKDSKFTITYPTLDRSTKVSDIRSWAKFNPFTVEEWMAWSLTAEGRRKQTEILQQFIPEATMIQIADIDSKINAKNGTLYTKRTELGKSLDAAKGVVKSFTITPEEETLLTKEEDTKKALEDLSKKKSEMDILRGGQENKQAVIDAAKEALDSYKESQMHKEKNLEADIFRQNEKINRLKKELEETEKEKETSTAKLKYEIEGRAIKVKELEDKYNRVLADNEVTFNEEDYQKLCDQVKRGTEFNDAITKIKTKKENLDVAYNHAGVLQKDYSMIEGEIEELRIKKTDLYSQSELPAENIVINDGETFLSVDGNLVPFTESDISYSTAGKIIARMLAKLNKETGIVLLGKSAEYNKKSLDELSKIAEEEDCMIFCDYVVEDDSELEVVIHPKSE
jgi:energy-coupling factor transporter ATP-binding protein EcfA2